MIRIAVLAAAVASTAGLAQPWDKYQFAPGPDRQFTPVGWSKTCGPKQPPAPPPASCPQGAVGVGGTIAEWTTPGTSAPQLTLDCATTGGGTFKAVDFASFGLPSGGCGSFQKSGRCAAANTSAWVASQCLGKSRCVLPADPTIRNTLSPLDQILGDPCPETTKHLSVQLSGCAGAGDGGGAIAAPVAAPAQPTLPVTLKGVGDYILFDFGKEIGGISTFNFGEVSDDGQAINIAYSESTYYNCAGDHSNGGSGPDGFISTGPIKAGLAYTPPLSKLRGGFRYIILIMATAGTVEVKLPSVHMTSAPNMPDPSNWKNFFYSNDELLNRIWYGAGWTTQLCSIDSNHGRQWPAPASGWDNNASCGTGDVILVDGAKRDRVIWPGDMGVSVLTAFTTTGDVAATRNALMTLYDMQLPNGMLPYAGPPVNFRGNSDTYHLWALIGTCNTVLIGNEAAWLPSIWGGFKKGVDQCTGRVSGPDKLFKVVNSADWARQGQGGYNVAANALLYRTLTCGAKLAGVMNDTAVGASYTSIAAALKTSINQALWDGAKGAYRDNPTSQMYPQDGNSLASWFDVASANQKTGISDYLAGNWGEFGASSPEWHDDIGTFPGSMEVHSHFAAGNATRAHDLIRLQWGYMINSPESSQSTFWEGYHKDGSFAYQGIYMSNSHGWATGPAAALTFNTLGLRPNGAGRYTVAPRPGGLTSCEGKLAFGASGQAVDVRWNVSATTMSITVDSTTFAGSLGAVQVPVGGVATSVVFNGVAVWTLGDSLAAAADGLGLAVTDGAVVLSEVRPQRLELHVTWQ